MLTKRRKSEILLCVSRWAMSPVHSPAAPSFRIRRRRVSPTTAGLFPENPDVSPARLVSIRLVNDSLSCDLTTVGCGSISDPATTDGPPASGTQHGTQSRDIRSVRNVAAVSLEGAPARLVGIARLAASSPPAETPRKSAEKPEHFVLPVKSILNRCDSQRVPFEWTINPYRGCEFACNYYYTHYTHQYIHLI